MNLETRFEGRPVGIIMALTGVLLLTPDTLLMRYSEMSGYTMVAWRGLLSCLVYFAFWVVGHKYGQGSSFRQLLTVSGVLLVLTQFFSATLFAVGVAIAPVSIVLFGVATVPIFAALLSWMIAGERAPQSLWFAIPLVICGIGVAMFADGYNIALNMNVILGGLAGLGVAFVIALSLVLVRLHTDLPFLLAIAVGALLAGLFGLYMSGGDIVSQGNLLPIIVTGLIILPVPFFLLTLASRYTLPANVSLILLLETTLGPLWVWLGFGEAPTGAMMIGGAIVVVTLAVYIRVSAK